MHVADFLELIVLPNYIKRGCYSLYMYMYVQELSLCPLAKFL